MSFTKEPTRTPTSLGDISIELFSPSDGGTPKAAYSIQVLLSDGSTRVLTGDLLPQLTAGQITTITNFMAAIRTKATAEILP